MNRSEKPGSQSNRWRETRRERSSHMERVYAMWSPVYDMVFAGFMRRGHQTAFRLLDPRPGESILEVGVGTGLTLEYYPNDTRVVGVDISEKMLEKARERAGGLSGVDLVLEVGDARKLRFEDAAFDAVLAAYVLTAVENPYLVVMEIRRVLKDGGRLVTVCNSNDHSGFWGSFRQWLAPVFWRFGFTTSLDVPELLRRCGFEVRRTEVMEPFRTHAVVEGVKLAAPGAGT